MSDRLEYVRESVHCATLRDFWRELTRNGGYTVSYEAIRNYHSHRDPPVDYLVQVSETFEVNLDWLATGRGGPWPGDPAISQVAELIAEGGKKEEFEVALREVFLQYVHLPALATAVILKTCDRLYRDAQFRAQTQGRSGPTRAYIGRFVGKALAGPLVNAVAGTVRTADLHIWQIESYVLGVCQALSALIPNPNWADGKFQEAVH